MVRSRWSDFNCKRCRQIWEECTCRVGDKGYGSIDGHQVTFAEGDRGDIYLADGEVSPSDFWGSKYDKGHDHYDSGNGRHNNGTDRGKYTGPGSR